MKSFPKTVVLIPYWIQDTLERNKENLSAAIDFSKLHKYVSDEDVRDFIGMSNHTEMLFGKENKSFAHFPWYDAMRLLPTDSEARKRFGQFDMSLVYSDFTKKSLEERLYSEGSYQKRYPDPFHVYDISRDYVGVVIYPGYFTAKDASQYHLPLVKAILDVLYRYGDLHEVAHTPTFSRYFELLNRAVAA